MEVPSIFLNRILSEVAKKGASSLHLCVGSKPMTRVNRKLITMEDESVLTVDIINKIIESFISEAEFEEFRKKKEIVIVKTFGANFRFRANIFLQKDLTSVSFNYIPVIIKAPAELGVSDFLKKAINLKSGLLIIAGTNDAGKTSTIASLIEEVNKNTKRYITTIENPIEYLFVNKESIIEQRQVGSDVESYTKGLEHCLIEDVDLVYIDEMKTEFNEAIPLILDLAAGNSLVVIEMNADDSVRIIERILNAGDKNIAEEVLGYSLADVLIGVVVQKLIPKIGGGLVLANEVMIVNSAIKSLIRERKIYQIESIIQTSRSEGMISLKKSIQELIRDGQVQADEIRNYSME